MGFLLSSLGLLVIFITIKIFGLVYHSFSSRTPHSAGIPSLPILLHCCTLCNTEPCQCAIPSQELTERAREERDQSS